jgi:ATP-binding cassette subfamily B protein
MMWHGGGRRAMREGRHTGLTGDPDIPDLPDEPRDWRSRLRSTRKATVATAKVVPEVLRLVWAADPWLTLGLGAATVLLGLLPAVIAYVSKLLVDAVVRAIEVHANPAIPDEVVASLPIFGEVTLTTVGALVALAMLQFVVTAGMALLSTIRNVTQQLLQEQVAVSIQLQVMRHAARLDLAFFEDSASYDLLRRAQTEASSRPVFMVSSVFGLVQTLVTFLSMIFLLIALNPLLALIALVAPVPAFIADARFGWRGFNLARWASPLRRRMEYLTTLVTRDTFAKEVKLFGLGDYFIDRFDQLARVYRARQQGLVTQRYLAGFGLGTISTLAGSVTYLYVALEAVAGRLTLGDLTLYTQAAQQVQGSVQGLLSGFSSMYEHQLYLSTLFQLLETDPGIEAPSARRPLPAPLRGAIEFRDVTFRYPDNEEPALANVSFSIAPGETLAVVGRNGAGKTTLIKLLCRLYDPDEGSITLDGVDLRDLDPAELRAQIGAIFQDYVEYQATVAENIGLGELSRIVDRLEIEQAGRQGGVDTLVGRLPDGYDTPLGKWFDGGAELSGGEWQKVALARAFMRESPILVLDEPTSALDPQAEYDLFARLRALAHGRTAIYISHRFSTVRQADRILFLERGRLVEQGTHEELLALGGRYARLFMLQASAYTGAPIPAHLAVDPEDAVAALASTPGATPGTGSAERPDDGRGAGRRRRGGGAGDGDVVGWEAV